MKKVPSTLLAGFVLFALTAAPAAAEITKVVNGASFASNNSFSPGTIITIRGNNLANTTVAAPDPTKPPKTLGGVTLTIGGVQCVLFYVSSKQINGQIDATVTPGTKTLTVASPTGTFTAQIEVVQAGSPGIFTLSGTGGRDGAILNAVTFDRGPFSVTTAGQPTYLAIFTTGLDLSTTPKVTVDGISLPVLYAGPAPGFIGLQQINAQLLSQLAGAGRVSVMITAGGKTTNVVEIVIVPSKGQGPFPSSDDNQMRNRELASLAWIPGTSFALLTDENDDVVRVIDIKARKVSKTIALPEGAEPMAVAVDPTGKIAVVAERDRNKVALIDLATYTVMTPEIAVGGGPSAVSTLGNVALVLNLDTDNVSILNLSTKAVIGTVDVGRSPRGISSDTIGNQLQAFVTNMNDGTISVIDVAQAKLIKTLNLGADVRPQAILALPGLGVAAVTEPSRHESGKVMLVSLSTGAILAEVDVNPDRSGGSSEMAFYNNTVYFNNQSGGSVTAAKVVVQPPSFATQTIKVGIGARALAVDSLDKLLLVTNQGSGEIVLINLDTGEIAGRINGVRGESEDDDDDLDDRDDRDKAANAPAITAVSPNKGKAGTSLTLTITGKNLGGATEVVFLDPDSLPGKGKGRGNGNSGNNGHGPFGKKDPAFTVTNLQVASAGTQLTAAVAIGASAEKGDRVVRVMTPNGETTFKGSSANTFQVE